MNDLQLSELSEMIEAEYYYLKPEEVLIFFARLKMGHYGTFYGNVDPIVITNALIIFTRERAEAYTAMQANKAKEQEREAEQARKEREERGELMTRTEFKEIEWLYNLGYECS